MLAAYGDLNKDICILFFLTQHFGMYIWTAQWTSAIIDPLKFAARFLTELFWTRSRISVNGEAHQATVMQGQVSESAQKHHSPESAPELPVRIIHLQMPAF